MTIINRALRLSLTAGTMAALLAAPAAAQNTSLRSNYGDRTENSGFAPDPIVVDVTAGGSVNGGNVGNGCRGMISNAPDFEFTYTAGSFPLYFRSISGSDTTLIINGPDGRWYCDDDSLGNRNAEVAFRNPQSGVYDIWVGTFSGGTAGARLEISELTYGESTGGGGGGGAGGLDMSLPANFGEVQLRAGFPNDPYTINTVSGGSEDASQVGNGCRGMVSRAPDFQLTYQAGRLPLTISTYSNSDTTLVINDANGNWVCDDDGGDGTNARVRFDRPASGVYDIWVGAYSGGNEPTTLEISERR